ncbi:CapA family protein [Candidatus Pacebacteria bacterium]|nr:CapA family protein [Candidatus Paceibacterota bacterium]
MRFAGTFLVAISLIVAFYLSAEISLARITFFESIGEIFMSADLFQDSEVTTKNESILLVGDVMLARDVELKMREYGSDYPYQYLEDIFVSHTYQVGNFEGSIPLNHSLTQSMELQFSVDPIHTQAFAHASFTHASLANNHSRDFGTSGYENTKLELHTVGVATFGQSYSVASSSVSVLELGQKKVALLGIDVTLSVPDTKELESAFKLGVAQSDFLIVFVHWGVEYAPIHSSQQEFYAKQFIELGADMIVGHHPHVVQDVQIYDGVPVFYSLGNFIFDQYFNEEVQSGLALSVSFEEGLNVGLIPITSLASKIAPRIMGSFEKDMMLQDLTKKSDKTLSDQILFGELSFTSRLAVSPQID